LSLVLGPEECDDIYSLLALNEDDEDEEEDLHQADSQILMHPDPVEEGESGAKDLGRSTRRASGEYESQTEDEDE